MFISMVLFDLVARASFFVCPVSLVPKLIFPCNIFLTFLLYVSTSFCHSWVNCSCICFMVLFRQRRGFQQLLENQEANQKTRKGSIKSTRIETKRRIKSIRSTGIAIKIEVKIRKRRRRIEVGSMIPVLITQRNTTTRFANC